jgi:hypothetical protein
MQAGRARNLPMLVDKLSNLQQIHVFPGTEVVPNPDKTLAFAVHMTLQTKHFILNHKNLLFDELIANKKYQFVYVFTPVPITGATGSPGVPIGIT